MSREFPDWINPWATAQGGRIFQGTLALSRMPRLVELLADTVGDARFSMAFSLDSDRRPVIELQVEAELALLCQASLEPFRLPVSRASTLGVVETESDHALLPGHYEPVVASGGRLAVLALVEDELLLSLPPVPRNPALDTVAFSTDGDPESSGAGIREQKPFAGLREIMERQTEQQDAD